MVGRVGGDGGVPQDRSRRRRSLGGCGDYCRLVADAAQTSVARCCNPTDGARGLGAACADDPSPSEVHRSGPIEMTGKKMTRVEPDPDADQWTGPVLVRGTGPVHWSASGSGPVLVRGWLRVRQPWLHPIAVVQ